MKMLKCRGWSSLLSCCLVAVLSTSGPPLSVAWAQPGPGEAPPPPPVAAPPAVEAPETPAPLSSDQLDQLVAPIALYPDALVAQVLAGATYPIEVVQAARWQSANAGLSGVALAAAVASQDWDPSIKALTQFPSVLANMNTNLSWTSALGQAYYYQPSDVLNAVQVMRQRALAAGTLMTTPQQTVVNENGLVTIAPANPDMVYVPTYNPYAVYGAPVEPYPGYSLGELLGVGALGFLAGVAVGWFANEPWGWNYWNTDWHHHYVVYQNNVYVSNTSSFGSVGGYGGGYRGGRGYGGGYRGGYAGGGRGGAGAGYGAGAQRGAAGAGYGAREMASREAGRMGAPTEARPGAGARPSYKPNVSAAPATRNVSRPQANPFRGFGKAPETGLNRGAFARISPGGEAIAASARGRSSFGRASTPARAAPSAHPAAHAGGGGGGGHKR